MIVCPKKLKKGGGMVKEIRARYSKGKIVPLEDLDLEEGAEIVISVKVKENELTCMSWKREVETAAKEAGITTEEQVVEMVRESRFE